MQALRLLTLLLVLGSTAALADDYCVDTDSEFLAAQNAVESNPGPNRILLRSATTFHLAGTNLAAGAKWKPDGALTMEGGYNADCSLLTSTDAASTVLDGTGAGAAGAFVEFGDDFTLSNLTVANLPGDFYIATPLFYDAIGAASGPRLRLLRTRFVGGGGIYITVSMTDDALVRVENSVFAGGSSGLSVTMLGGSNGRAVLVNDTITANTGNGLEASMYDGAVLSVYNSILYGNHSTGGNDWHMDGGTGYALAINNIIGSFDGSYSSGSSGNINSNPLFVSASDYNLQLASPARDSGTSTVPYGLSSYDVEGGARVVGAKVDRGAYENNNSGALVLPVTNANNAGTGSLRAAIDDANANPGYNVISFNIPGSCPHTIALASELPAITDSVIINGYTQPGAKLNSSTLFTDNAAPCVEVKEASGVNIVNGLHFVPAADGDDFTVSGLSIGGFNTGIYIDNSLSGTHNAFNVWGNFIGVAADGTTSRPNTTFGINVSGPSYGSIGGPDPEQRNVIAGGFAGVRLSGDNTFFDNSSVANNFIGTAKSGNVARPNTVGVAVISGYNQITDNLVSGNSGSGIQLSGSSAQNNAVTYNRIGVKALALCVPPCTPDYDLGNGGSGVTVGATFNRIASNTIAYNGGDGVSVTGGNYNNISANAMYANTGLGIDLGPDGVNPNDNDSAAASTANEGRNYPVLGTAFGGNRSGKVTGTLGSVNGDFTLNFYASDSCDASGHGEGRYFLGSAKVTISNATAGNDGQVNFSLPLTNAPVNLSGKAITVTAARYGSAQTSTSEFSACITYQYDDTIFVDNFEVQGP